MTDPRLIESYRELEELLGCQDNSCLFKKKKKYNATYQIGTNGGCRCFKDIEPWQKSRAIERLVRVVKKIVEEDND